ncbi:PspC domain-containing protein [Corynebacterium bovis]|uniref:PspC domain-containing protein n=1 Tax=Corynebacterium bovis TaxID=36808 RepID=UPI00313920F8
MNTQPQHPEAGDPRALTTATWTTGPGDGQHAGQHAGPNPGAWTTGPGPHPGPTSDITATLRAMWATRPSRVPRSRFSRSWLAGVCEGIALRYQISLALVRLLFVVGTLLSGAGVLVYLLAVLVLPCRPRDLSPVEALVNGRGDPAYSRDRSMVVFLGFAALVYVAVAGVQVLWSGLWALPDLAVAAVVTGGLWWILHAGCPVPPAGTSVDRGGAAAAEGSASTPEGATHRM